MINLFSYILLISSILLFEAQGQKVKWEDDTTLRSKVSFESDQKRIKDVSESGRKTNEIVSKNYFSHPSFPGPGPDFPPLQMQPHYNLYPSEIGGSAGENPWEWSSVDTTQHARKPSYIHFPGENFPNGIGGPISAINSFSSNNGQGPSTSYRIDETCQCGVVPIAKNSNQKLQRIVGGGVSKNSWPWMVAIAYIGQSKPFWFCGGSLISDKYVMTAAHCLKTIRSFGLSNVKLIMGTNNLMDSKAAVYYSIRGLRPHPLYKPGTEDYDIALLEVKEKVDFTTTVSPICLTQEGHPFINRTVIVAGWGSLQNGEGPPADLREVDLKVVSNEMCAKEYYDNYQTSVTSAMMCAWLPGKDSCQGDSGGPLFLKTTSSSHAYTQLGVVSFGPPRCGVTSVPGVYTRVASAIKWIKSLARIGKFCKGSFS